MKLSEIFHRAADLLWDGCRFDGSSPALSCLAIVSSGGPIDRALDFVADAGCEPGRIDGFDEFKFGEERQSVRYAWLKLLAYVAEQENL